MNCEACPCVDICLRRPIFCAWARDGNDNERRHICARSALGETPAPPPHEAEGAPADGPTAAEAVALALAARRCPYRSRDAGCGCSGSLCALRPPQRRHVALNECFHCVRRYGEP